ncbi:MAG: hypothetical protein H0U22_01650 [Geodermatophilaceae bacterium]|nr:hypothetical protein [Geodermatophilaceae bacterium]
MQVDSWPGEWSSEFTDLLSALTRLVAAEPAQAALLVKILDGPLLTMDTLADAACAGPLLPKIASRGTNSLLRMLSRRLGSSSKAVPRHRVCLRPVMC